MTPKDNPHLIVSGMPHSGTTFLSKLITANTSVLNCAFECGVLLSKDSPRDFHKIQPFYDWLTYPISSGHWGLSEKRRDWVCATDSWIEFYDRLALASPIIKEGQGILDKTPQYTFNLINVLEKTPKTPTFITYKDPILLYLSYKTRGAPLVGFMKKLKLFYASISAAIQKHPDRIHIFSHKTLCEKPLQELKRAFSILNLPIPTQISKNIDWDTLPPLSKDFDYKKSLDEAFEILKKEETDSILRLIEDTNINTDAFQYT